MTTLKIGDMAPDFTLPSTIGEKVTLSDYRGKKNVLLLFYPLDFSPTCSRDLVHPPTSISTTPISPAKNRAPC